MKCPVCKHKRNDEAFCSQCAWEFKTYVHELSPEEKKLYETRLAIAVRNWEQIHSQKETPPSENRAKPNPSTHPVDNKQILYSEDTPIPELKRDVFDTPETYIEKIKNYPPVPAGTARLIKDKGDKRYDIVTGKFPVELEWKDWVKGIYGFPYHKTEAHIFADVKLARAIYEVSPSHPVFFKLKADGEMVFFENALLFTDIAVLNLEGLLNIISLRKNPKALTGDDVKAMLKKYRFYCALDDWSKDWANPFGDFQNDLVDNGDGTLTDWATGLIWEKAGSESAIPYDEAHHYVQRLRERDGKDWRLPTLEELASLLVNQKRNGLFIHSLFNKTQHYCWSSDQKIDTPGSAWLVSFGSGGVDCYSHSSQNYVRAVRSR